MSKHAEAAVAVGYLASDDEYDNCLRDAIRTDVLSTIRSLFAYIVALCEVHKALEF